MLLRALALTEMHQIPSLWRKQSQSNKNKKNVLTPKNKYIFVMGTLNVSENVIKKPGKRFAYALKVVTL